MPSWRSVSFSWNRGHDQTKGSEDFRWLAPYLSDWEKLFTSALERYRDGEFLGVLAFEVVGPPHRDGATLADQGFPFVGLADRVHDGIIES